MKPRCSKTLMYPCHGIKVEIKAPNYTLQLGNMCDRGGDSAQGGKGKEDIMG